MTPDPFSSHELGGVWARDKERAGNKPKEVLRLGGLGMGLGGSGDEVRGSGNEARGGLGIRLGENDAACRRG